MVLIDRDALLVVPNVRKVSEFDEAGYYVNYNAVPVEAIENAPTVEVIRCKDCQTWGRSPYGHPTIGWCIVHGRHRAPDYFCASAKKCGSVEVKADEM